MKQLTAIIGAAFVMFVSVAAMDNSPVGQTGPAVQAAQHAGHAADGKGCCDKADGICARDGKACYDKTDCCKDGCCKVGDCKDGRCKDKPEGCCKQQNGDQTNGTKDSCCKKAKPQPKKPVLIPSH